VTATEDHILLIRDDYRRSYQHVFNQNNKNNNYIKNIKFLNNRELKK